MTKYILPPEFIVGYENFRGNNKPEIPLGFATFKEKGKLRKQMSWENWRDEKVEPTTHQNAPTSGFRIGKTQQRSTDWFGSGRHVFRITDPRGFELEITPENLLSIMSHTIIENGSIHGKCVWIWSKAGKLALVPETADLYQEAINFTKVRNAKVSLRDVKVGDTILTQNDETCLYLGKFHFLSVSTDHVYGSGGSAATKNTTLNQVPRHVIYDVEHESITFVSTLKVSRIVESVEVAEDYFEYIKSIVEMYRTRSTTSNNYNLQNENYHFYPIQRIPNVKHINRAKSFIYVTRKASSSIKSAKIELRSIDKPIEYFKTLVDVHQGCYDTMNVCIKLKNDRRILKANFSKDSRTKPGRTTGTKLMASQWIVENRKNQPESTFTTFEHRNAFVESSMSRLFTARTQFVYKQFDIDDIEQVFGTFAIFDDVKLQFNTTAKHTRY